MTQKAKRVTQLRGTALPQASQGPDGACPPAFPAAPRVARCGCVQRFLGFEAPAMTCGGSFLRAGFCCGGT